jgi:hypothetical protein
MFPIFRERLPWVPPLLYIMSVSATEVKPGYGMDASQFSEFQGS